MALLFECCRFTEYDKMSLMPSKDNDTGYEEKRSTKDSGLDMNEDEDEEDYEIGENEYFTTLRKSSAFTIERYSSKNIHSNLK